MAQREKRVFAVFVCFLPVFGIFRPSRCRFCGLCAASGAFGVKIFSSVTACCPVVAGKSSEKNEKKFWWNGKWLYFCTRFRPEDGDVEKGSARTLKRLKQEIACVGDAARRHRGHGESKVKNEEILTMKSLILAQDER